jgi:hypothetical protein
MTKEYWKETIDQWQSSGKSMAEFCRHEDISYWTFREWKKRLESQAESRLVKLNTVKMKSCADSTASPLQIELNGIRITIAHHFDEDHLIKLITTLRKLP